MKKTAKPICSTGLTVLVMAVAGGLSLGTAAAFADLEVTVGVEIHAAADFYEPLARDGSWIEVVGYGRCWRPAHVAVAWQPYCDGTWVWTDCGWYWESGEPWAWACYHYGGWVYSADSGWIWVPDVIWAPAWVVWREGGGYIGWAPCAPHGEMAAEREFVFVEDRDFPARHRLSAVMVNNPTIYHKTMLIAGDRREQRHLGDQPRTVVVNRGPDVNRVEKASGRRLATVSVEEVDRRRAVPASLRQRREGTPDRANSSNVAKPKLPPAAAAAHPDRAVTKDRTPPAEKDHREGSDQGEDKGHDHERP